MGLFVTKDLAKHWRNAISAGAGLIAAMVGLLGAPVLDSPTGTSPAQAGQVHPRLLRQPRHLRRLAKLTL